MRDIRSLRSAQQLAMAKLKEKFDVLNYETSIDDDGETLRIKAKGCTLKNHDDDIFMGITLFDNGFAIFRLIFDKLEKDFEALDYVNDFNKVRLY